MASCIDTHILPYLVLSLHVRLLVTKPNFTPAMLLKKYSAQEDRAKLAGLVGVTEALDMRMLCRCALIIK